MRNFILGGASRSGKSSASRGLRQKCDLNWYPIDPMIVAFESVYPQLGITHARVSDEEIATKLGPFFWKLLDDLGLYYKRNGYGSVAQTRGYLVDTCYVLPAEAASHNEGDLTVAFFGYPRLDAETKFSQIRAFETPDDWTRQMSDHNLMEHVRRWIEDSKFYERECARHQVPFFDTSFNFQVVVNDALLWLSGRAHSDVANSYKAPRSQ